MNNSSELWAIAVISGCLVPGPGMVEAREYCFLEYGGQIEEIWIVSLYIKVMLLAEPFANSKTDYSEKRSLSLARKVFKMSKHHNIQKMKYMNNALYTLLLKP